ncbi:MAG: energy transducer TonB [Acidobacteria bacterium]|nr:energy transducer TonB [Acidobacteriota bacterium]
MKTLIRLYILPIIIALYSSAGMAQDASSWVEVSPEGEAFTLMMPLTPEISGRKYQSGRMNVTGKLYSVNSDGITYRVWSLNDQALANSALADQDSYLDSCADLVWESMLKAEREKVEKSRGKIASMNYRRELLGGAFPGREYSITLGTAQGLVHFYIAQSRIYVLVVMSPIYNSELIEQFLKSFTTKQKSATIDADPILFPRDETTHFGNSTPTGTATGGNTATSRGGEDYNRVFSPREVTQKARILSKPEPEYTEAARKYAVSGTVVLRAVFSSTGELTNIRVLRKLPHGLTEQSVIAARGMKFQPPIKDGRPVSQYIQIEYNFNLY